MGVVALLGAAASPAAADACPNAQYRYGPGAHLPDCRAYEQVSPVDKGDSDVGGIASLVSRDGNAAVFSSYGPLPGSASGTAVNSYAAARREGSWLTSPLSPPWGTQVGGLPAFALVYGATPDFRQALVATSYALAPGAIVGGDVQNLYVHDTADNAYRLVATATTDHFRAGQQTFFGGASSDGSRWVFTSTLALDSTPAPPSGNADKLYAWSPAGGLRYIGVLPDGTVDTHGSSLAGMASMAVAAHVVSDDATKVYWTDTSGGAPVYLRKGEETAVVSHDASGTAKPGTFSYATPDGAYALVTSTAKLTGNASAAGTDLYRYDASTEDLIDLTPSSEAAGARVIGAFGASDDGRYVYYLAQGVLANGATSGEDNVYVWHQAADGSTTTRFIGTLAGPRAAFFERGFTNASLGARNGIGSGWGVSPDGRGFGFRFDGAITGPHPQPDSPHYAAYYYSYDDDTLDCASCTTDGTSVANVMFTQGRKGSSAFGFGYTGSSSTVADQGRLFFNSQDALVPGDTNGTSDIYEYERDGSGSCAGTAQNGGCVSLISPGRTASVNITSLDGVSASGDAVFFTTYDQLVGQDVDDHRDMYVARVGGGLAGQVSPEPVAPCTGDACKGAPSPAPLVAPPGTASFVGLPGATTSSPKESAGPIKVSKVKTVRGTSTTVKVKVPEKGTLRTSGSGLRRSSKTAKKAGTYRVAVRLSQRARRTLARKRRVKVRVTVRFAPAKGKTQRVRKHVTFKKAKKKRRSSSRSQRRAHVLSTDVRKGR